MEIKEPTQDELKWFWKKCGLIEQPTGSWYTDTVPTKFVWQGRIPLTTDNLDKYAVPRIEGEYQLTIKTILRGYYVVSAEECSEEIKRNMFYILDTNLTLALFWVIYKVFKEKVDD